MGMHPCVLRRSDSDRAGSKRLFPMAEPTGGTGHHDLRSAAGDESGAVHGPGEQELRHPIRAAFLPA